MHIILTVIIQTERDEIYGCFINATINCYAEKKGNDMKGIVDPQSFVFAFKKGRGHQYPIKKEKEESITFHLFREDSVELFGVGEKEWYDLWVGKKGGKMMINQSERGNYEYFNGVNQKTGKRRMKVLDVKRIIVIQFK